MIWTLVKLYLAYRVFRGKGAAAGEEVSPGVHILPIGLPLDQPQINQPGPGRMVLRGFCPFC